MVKTSAPMIQFLKYLKSSTTLLQVFIIKHCCYITK